MRHRTAAELDAGLAHVLAAPADHGTLDMLVARPYVDGRKELTTGRLTVEEGLEGDTWSIRPSTSSPDGGPHPERQVTLIRSRVVDLLTGGDRSRWALTGDQLVVDLDLSPANVPPGTRLAVGTAVIEVTAAPHRGCAKFGARFGPDALRFVNTGQGREASFRGVNAKVVTTGVVGEGDVVVKSPPA